MSRWRLCEKCGGDGSLRLRDENHQTVGVETCNLCEGRGEVSNDPDQTKPAEQPAPERPPIEAPFAGGDIPSYISWGKQWRDFALDLETELEAKLRDATAPPARPAASSQP